MLKTVTKLLLTAFSALLVGEMKAQTLPDGYYRLTTQWQGEGKSLDVVNDGTNNQIQLANTTNAAGQFWKIKHLGNGYYRLTTQWLGEGKSLDVVNDGTNNRLQLANTTNATGQFWKISPINNQEGGYYRFTTQWQGEGKSLDVVNDGTNNRLQLANTTNATGQYWRLKLLQKDPVLVPTVQQAVVYRHGFKILLNVDTLRQPESQEALNILTTSLQEITRLVKPEKLALLRQVPIWIEYALLADRAMWYNPSKEWLVANGYKAEKAKCVEILNVKNFVNWQKLNQPYMVLHELAHGYHDLFMTAAEKANVTAAYKAAQNGGKYLSVPYGLGGNKKAYALETENEYFAELTEAYFGKNDYFPYNRTDLKGFDIEGFNLLESVWNR